jgi:hypothetical protein
MAPAVSNAPNHTGMRMRNGRSVGRAGKGSGRSRSATPILFRGGRVPRLDAGCGSGSGGYSVN